MGPIVYGSTIETLGVWQFTQSSPDGLLLWHTCFVVMLIFTARVSTNHSELLMFGACAVFELLLQI